MIQERGKETYRERGGMAIERYPSDLTNAEWSLLEPLISSEKPGGRPREVDMQAVLNGVFSVPRTGCAWRMIPHEYPPKSTVYASFAPFHDDGTWEPPRDELVGTLSHPGWT
jgi:putative transposase